MNYQGVVRIKFESEFGNRVIAFEFIYTTPQTSPT